MRPLGRCSTCRWWEPHPEKESYGASRPGYCHQRPPVPVMAFDPSGGPGSHPVIRTVWPVTYATGWCSRHRRMREAEPDAAAPAGNETPEPAIPPAGSEAAPDAVGGAVSRLSAEAAA